MSNALIRSAAQPSQAWIIFVLAPILLLSCSGTTPHSESLSENYWEVQALRMQSGKPALRDQALRDLGAVYLRTGRFETAEEILAQVSGRKDPQVWFYRGLTQELLDHKDEALALFMQDSSLTDNSIYSQATKGRIAWLLALAAAE